MVEEAKPSSQGKETLKRGTKLKEGRFVKSVPRTTKNNGSKCLSFWALRFPELPTPVGVGSVQGVDLMASETRAETLQKGRMDYSLQVHGAKYVFPIPDGLKELSNDIIREVLRHQPQHINGFIADYLETMLQVREHARDAGVVISDVLHEGIFFDQLHRIKNVDRKQVNYYATLIQAAWRGFAARKRVAEWLQKKKKIEENREVKKELKIEEFLAALGITYSEAKRAAKTIQSAYKETKRGKWISGEMGEFWVAETVPFGERLKEDDRVQGRFRQWDTEDFGDFFEMDEAGAIQYDWPRVGQLRRVLRDDVPPNVPLVEFFAMRDLEGKEQYSYLIKTPTNERNYGRPVGFIVPRLKYHQDDTDYPEVAFVDPLNEAKMGRFTYVFRDDVKREEVQTYAGILKAGQNDTLFSAEGTGENEAEISWVLPRVLVRIKKELLQSRQDEMKFLSLSQTVTCEQEDYTFVAETFEQSLKIMKHILRNPCISVEEGLTESANMKPYKLQETGRIFPVEKFIEPTFIQKIHIPPESSTAEEESVDIMLYNYIFLPTDYRPTNKMAKAEPTYSIPIIRFQGYHSDYKGSIEAEEDNKVFIMGPKLPSPDGKPFTYESLFWDEYGIEAWYQLLYNREALENEIAEEEMKPVSQETTRLGGSKADSSRQKGLSEGGSIIPSSATQEAIPSIEVPETSERSMEMEEKAEKLKTSDEEAEGEEKAQEEKAGEEKPEKDLKFEKEGRIRDEEAEQQSEAQISSVQNAEPAEEKPKPEETEDDNQDNDNQPANESQDKAED